MSRTAATFMPRIRALLLLAAGLAVGCDAQGQDASNGDGPSDELVIAAYTAPREAFQQGVFPAFREHWRRQTGRAVQMRGSYMGSGAQSRAVVQGFEADVAVLALEGDVDRIAKAGLMPADWRQRTGNGGVVARSLVVIAVREGNPRGIRDFPDLAQPGIEVLTPNPRTSGGAMWNLTALYGSVLLAHGETGAGSAEAATELVRRIFGNVTVMDKGARESLVNFERGIGDAALTYEQEVHVAHRAGRHYDYVVPPRTIAIDIPAAVIETNARAHGRLELAQAFVAFLRTPQAKQALSAWGFRPSDPEGFAAPSSDGAARPFPKLAPDQTFEIGAVGGWKTVVSTLFGPTGRISRAIEGQASWR